MPEPCLQRPGVVASIAQRVAATFGRDGPPRSDWNRYGDGSHALHGAERAIPRPATDARSACRSSPGAHADGQWQARPETIASRTAPRPAGRTGSRAVSWSRFLLSGGSYIRVSNRVVRVPPPQSLVSKGERGAAEFAGEHLLSARNEGRRRLHRRPRGQVSKFSTGAAEERQENPWSREHSPGAKSSHCGRT